MKFCVKFNEYIDKGDVSINKEVHYFRNRLNRAPETLAEMIEINKTLPEDKNWYLLSVGNSVFHMYPTEFSSRGEFNLKIVSYNGLWEAVYNEDGILLTEYNDPVNMSTYNYCGPVNILGKIEHGFKDVFNYDNPLPFLKYGNVEGVPVVTWSKSKENKRRYNDSIEAQQYRKEFLEKWEGIRNE